MIIKPLTTHKYSELYRKQSVGNSVSDTAFEAQPSLREKKNVHYRCANTSVKTTNSSIFVFITNTNSSAKNTFRTFFLNNLEREERRCCSNNMISSNNVSIAQHSFDSSGLCDPQKTINTDQNMVTILPVVTQTNVAKIPVDTYTIYNPSINFFDDYQPFSKEPRDDSQRLRINSVESNNNNAAREVEAVHNYSKVLSNGTRNVDETEDAYAEDLGNSNDMDTGASSGDSGEITKTADGEKTTPEHHARRPMNAFLIFCKRHRAIVREKYPNLENRSITKILGDWWANLDNDEKTCYTDLAKQYKDAFFSANPNFRWYKLPAPPLRTLNTRPGNAERPSYLNESFDSAYRSDDNQYNDELKRKARPSNVGLFKLADEAQMGGLSSLMVSYNSIPKSSNNNVGEDDPDPTGPQKELQNELNETQSFLNKAIPATVFDSSVPMPTNAKRKQIDDYYQIDAQPTTWTEFEPFVGGRLQLPPRQQDYYDDDYVGKKSSRACKGKRYKEFMQSGKINACVRKQKSITNGGFYKSEQLSPNKNEFESLDHMYASPAKLACYDDVAKMMNGISSADTNNLKRFDASDFDLEDKIRALPSLSLDKYLSRKRDTKKKKKINVKRPLTAASGNHHQIMTAATAVRPPQTIQEAKDRIKNAMVGSQKRKARKESITRRDIQQDTGVLAVVDNGDVMALVAEDPIVNNGRADGTSDLLFLATLAAATLGNIEN